MSQSDSISITMQPQQPQQPYQGPPVPPQMPQPMYNQPGTPMGYNPAPMQKPKKEFNFLIIPLVVFILLTLGSAGFGYWAFSERNTYKFQTDRVVEKAVEIAVTEAETKKDNEFLEEEKKPLKSYQGPSSFGTVKFSYPKTWSAQVSDDGKATSNTPVDGYLHPNYIPTQNDTNSFALRIQVVASSYDSELKKFDADIKQGKTKVLPYRAQQIPDVLGSRVEGQLDNKHRGVMILIPLRDKTLKVWTEADQFVKDFDTNILPSLTFVP